MEELGGELFLEGLVGADGGEEVFLGEGVGGDGFQGAHGGVAGLVAEEGDLTEKGPVFDHRGGARRIGGRCGDDLRAAVGDDVEFIADFALADDIGAGGEILLIHLLRDIGEIGGRHVLEDGAFFKNGADDHVLLHADVGDNVTVDHVHEAVGHAEDAVVVGHDHDGGAIFVREFAEEGDDVGPAVFIEGGGGFVGEDEAGAVDERAADGDALALAAGEVAGFVIYAFGEAEGGEGGIGEGVAFGRGDIGEFDGHLDVLAGGEGIEEVVGLKDEADVAAHLDLFEGG